MNVLYTDNDPKCCAWLEQLVSAGQLPAGRIVCRDIQDFKPGDFDGYKQVHHFCGIGGWPYALKLAGWPEGEEVMPPTVDVNSGNRNDYEAKRAPQTVLI